jgi:3-isopropylmalate dehydrogenase
MGAILTAALMLEHLGWSQEANRIESAVASSVEDGQTTVDIGGSLGTREAGEAIGARLRTQT